MINTFYCQKMRVIGSYLVTVPIFQELVFANRPEIVCLFRLIHLTYIVLLKRDLHDTLVMREDRLVAVAEVEAPYLHVLI